jgi:hypothetical protein
MISLATVQKAGQIFLNGDELGSIADFQGEDAMSSLLLQAVDSMAVDSTELIREEVTALV